MTKIAKPNPMKTPVPFGFRNKEDPAREIHSPSLYRGLKSASGIRRGGDGFSVPSVILIAASSDL